MSVFLLRSWLACGLPTFSEIFLYALSVFEERVGVSVSNSIYLSGSVFACNRVRIEMWVSSRRRHREI